MDTGSDLSIYTNIFGWYYYDLFIQLISSYGLWIIGFLFLLWQATFVLASRNGRYDPRSSLLNAEYNIYLMLFILVFAVIPSISVNASFFHNNGKAAGATGSSFDALNSTSPGTIKLPAAWFIVWKTNAAITSVFRAAMPNQDNMREMLTAFQDLMITDDGLAAEVGSFNSHCFAPALSTYKTLGRDYPNSKIYLAMQNALTSSLYRDRTSTNPSPEFDVYYQGNNAFTQYLYQNGAVAFCAAGQDPNAVFCLPRMNTVDNIKIPSISGIAGADCNSWWGTTGSSGLKNKIIDHMNAVRPDDVSLAEKAIQAMGWDSSTHLDMLTSKALNTNAAPQTRSPYNEGAWNDLKEGAQAGVLTMVNWWAQFLNSVMSVFLPQLHAVMVLLVLIMAPIISIVGLAKPAAILRLLLVAFIINLWIPIWIVVGWVDNVLLSLLYQNTGWLASTFDLGYVLASLLSLSLYTAIPMLASYYIYIAVGSQIASTAGGLARAGGAAGMAAGATVLGGSLRSGIGLGRTAGRIGMTAGRGAKRLAGK